MASPTVSSGFAHAVIRTGSDVVLDDLGGTYHRVEYFRPGA
jgi:hypothetical protein